VLEPLAERRKKGGVEGLDVAESGSLAERVRFALAEAGVAPRTAGEIAKGFALETEPVHAELDALVASGEALRLTDGRVLSHDGLDAARERVRDEFAVHGKAYP